MAFEPTDAISVDSKATSTAHAQAALASSAVLSAQSTTAADVPTQEQPPASGVSTAGAVTAPGTNAALQPPVAGVGSSTSVAAGTSVLSSSTLSDSAALGQPLLAAAPLHINASRRGSSSSIQSNRAIHFPVLPASQPLPNQTKQTPSQVASILSLPTPLLLNLARTTSPDEQREIASKAQASLYLSAMGLPPPSPTEFFNGGLVSRADPSGATANTGAAPIPITSIGDHPAIPVLLGQAFAPPTPGIVAPAAQTTSTSFEPIYASIEDWSFHAAREQVDRRRQEASSSGATSTSTSTASSLPPLRKSHSFNEKEIATVAQQMAKWAIEETEKQVQQQVASSKETAVLLAAEAAARAAIVSAASDAVATASSAPNGQLPAGMSQADVQAASVVVSGGPDAGAAVESAIQEVDLSPYAESYKQQLDMLASGYFAQLHREALKRILNAADTPSGENAATMGSGADAAVVAPPAAASSTLPIQTLKDAEGRTTLPQAQAMHVQAAAAAAVAANVMAAKEMASVAGNALENMGVNVPTLMPEPPVGGLKLLEVTPDAIAKSPSSVSATAASSSTIPSTQATDTTTAASLPNAARPRLPTSVSSSATPESQPSAVTQFLRHPSSSDSRTPEKRDYLLSYAHTLYTKDPFSAELLPLLHTLEQTHEDHLPTLLLLSCVYYTRGELESSFYYNKKLLAKDPEYVEAMSNIGTTLRAMGKWRDAETWWFKAIRLRPTYWDATENLLGVLCNPSTTISPAAAHFSANDPPPTAPRYQEALVLCDYVESQVFATSSVPTSQNPAQLFIDPSLALPRPRQLPIIVPIVHIHRLQNLFYAKGNLRTALGDPAGGQDEYEKAVEIALSLPAWIRDRATVENTPPAIHNLTTRDLVVATVVLGKILAAYAGPENERYRVAEYITSMGLGSDNDRIDFSRLFVHIQNGGADFVRNLLADGQGVLPTVLLQPEQLRQLPYMLFPQTNTALPSLLDPSISPETDTDPARRSAIASTNQTTSTMLLTLAKVFQDSMSSTSASHLSLGGIPASQSLLLPLYYVALALYPSPSTCNNLGILLSTMSATTVVASSQPGGPPILLTGQQLALRYYEAGLRLDPQHPHLFTNLGSLLKDMGQLPQAVAMYKRAVEFNPTFDVALANLANAVKDTGQIQESIPYYRRAVELNPNFPEAICGLVNALGGVCDWHGRGGVGEDWVVNHELQLVPASSLPQRSAPGQIAKVGYMGKISELVSKQLQDGMAYGQGSMRTIASLEGWLAVIIQAIYDCAPEQVPHQAAKWAEHLRFVLSDMSEEQRRRHCVNEGGFLIRLIERVTRRTQRRWYLNAYGQTLASDGTVQRIVANQGDLAKYRRLVLPPSLPPCAVPTVLPFHCFTLTVTARETRLISHRTGLRISHSTLNQPWLPPIVYPPPVPPVNGKINIGYVSSDLGNHPLSHLMQSVFGMHDRQHFNVFCYATSPSDKSSYRVKIEAEAQHFVDVSADSTQQIVDRIVHDQIHVLINLSGYTKGARNEVFAARPAPVQMSYMGFAGTLSAGWCDYFIVDPVVCPPSLVSGTQWRYTTGAFAGKMTGNEGPTDFEGDPDPESAREDFVYTEKLMYLPHSYFVTDHKQAWRDDPVIGMLPSETPILDDGTPARQWAIEEDKRWKMRKLLFPSIRDDTFIFACWNQLYKIDPFIFRIWLNILQKHPNSVLWLLRFPAPGEAHLKATALKWAGKSVADRVIFTDVANKNDHIHRGRVADLFLDTTECNAHTTAADILWSGTPLLTFPRHHHKMASRVAASIAIATGHGKQMIVHSGNEYEQRALDLAGGMIYDMLPPLKGVDANRPEARAQRRGKGELAQLRKQLFLTRESSPLFDTKRWVENMERGVVEAWRRWVNGTEFEDSDTWGEGQERQSGCIWVKDAVDGANMESRREWIAFDD